MSGIAGILNLDGAPIQPGLLDRMIDHINHRGPDGCDRWTRGSVALGHQMLHTTPESLHERQPLADEHERVCLVLDGRVDNRNELRRDVERAGGVLREDTDAELVLKSYLIWGERCPGKIIGDFSFAIWDASRQILFCARDFIGVKPFFYFYDNNRFLFGSELRQVADLPGVPRVPNQGMIGEVLADRITSREETLYVGILRLPPAHTLRVEAGQVRLQRYWFPNPTYEIQYKSDQDYADHLFELLSEAVRCRMRSQLPVSAELSGGVDSSSVVAMGHHLFQIGAVSQPVVPFSLVFNDLACDESPYIQAVLDHLKIDGQRIDPTQVDFHHYREESTLTWDLPSPPNGKMSDPLRAAVRQAGSRVLMTGLGGDERFTSDLSYFQKLVRLHRYAEFARLARQERVDFRSLVRVFLSPWKRYPIVRRLRAVWRKKGLPVWIDPRFIRDAKLNQRLFSPGFGDEAGKKDGILHAPLSLDPYSLLAMEWTERSNAYEQIEARHPFDDQRIVEFAMALPYVQCRRSMYEKFVLRKAMIHHLPDRVARRTDKAEFSIIKRLVFSKFYDIMAPSMVIFRGEYVDYHKFRKALSLYIHHDDRSLPNVDPNGWPLWMAMAIEYWMESMGMKSSGL